MPRTSRRRPFLQRTISDQPLRLNFLLPTAPGITRRPISDQEERRGLSILHQCRNRSEAYQLGRNLASSVISLQCSYPMPNPDESESRFFDVRQASKWFASQIMQPEWMIDVPVSLGAEWYVLARPAGKRCLVVSSDGTTISRLLNGSILHRFPSALPGGATKEGPCGPEKLYSILDCIFHEPDQTYYVIDMVCWTGYSLYKSSAATRFLLVEAKLAETGACDPPSLYHKFRFEAVPLYDCDETGFHSAYGGSSPYAKDGLLFYNKHAHYHTGNTPLVLIWKDERCSQHVIDTDDNGEVPHQQHIVLELQEDGKVVTSDDPPVPVGCLNADFVQRAGLSSGSLILFAIGDGGSNCLEYVDDSVKADLHCFGVSNRAFADSYSKIMFQFMARHFPLKVEALVSTISRQPSRTNHLGREDNVRGVDEYWRKVAESDGFDIEGIQGASGMDGLMEFKCEGLGYYVYLHPPLIKRYARTGLHHYNTLEGTNFEFNSLVKFNKVQNCVSPYFITLHAFDPLAQHLREFQVRVDENSYASLDFTVSIARPKGETTSNPFVFIPLDERAVDGLPSWPSEDAVKDTTRFHVVEGPELLVDITSWIRMYLELAVCIDDRLISDHQLSMLEIVKVIIGTEEGVNQVLKAKDLNVYITFKGLAIGGIVGVDDEQRAIVRRVVNESRGYLSLRGELLCREVKL